MTWNCLLVDDEPLAIEVLKSHIANIEYLQIAGCCNNAFKAMELLQTVPVNLLFLDILMPKLMGTTFFKTLQNPPKVIFTTAHKEFALEAFELDAVDYLLKPVSFERFLKAVNKLVHPHLLQNEDPMVVPETKSGFTYFRSERKMVKVLYDEILYVESLKDYIRIFRENGPPLMVKQSISETELLLPAAIFIRIHRSFIVSINKITSITRHDIEIGKIEIPVGRAYNKQLEFILDKKEIH